MSTPIVPHEVPVENEIKEPTPKITRGNHCGARFPCKSKLKASAAPSAEMTPPNIQAAKRIATGPSKSRTPAKKTGTTLAP